MLEERILESHLTETEQRPLPPGYNIRAARPEDLSGLQSLLRPYVEQKMILRRTKAELLALMSTGFVAVYEDEIVGFSSVEIYSKKLGEIQCLAVSEKHQGQGLGGSLVAHCVQLAKQRGVMEVMAISASDKFLIHQGFDYSLPNQKKALFIQLRSREEVYAETQEEHDD